MTVTSVAPTETGTSVSDGPSTSTLAIAVSSAAALQIRLVPPKAGVASIASDSPPRVSETSGSCSATTGTASSTVTRKDVRTVFALPVAVTVIVAVPGDRGVMTTLFPTIVTEAMPGAEDTAVVGHRVLRAALEDLVQVDLLVRVASRLAVAAAVAASIAAIAAAIAAARRVRLDRHDPLGRRLHDLVTGAASTVTWKV